MRNVLFLLAVLVACGNDVSSEVDGGVTVGGDGAPGGDGGTTGDAQALTDCQAAAQHSDLAWIQQHVFTPSCAKSTCHAGASPEVGLSLEAGQARSQLVNHDSSTQPGWVRVVPGDPARSYLLVSLGRGEGPMPRDGFMPLGPEGALCPEKIDAIQRWIANGAVEN